MKKNTSLISFYVVMAVLMAVFFFFATVCASKVISESYINKDLSNHSGFMATRIKRQLKSIDDTLILLSKSAHTYQELVDVGAQNLENSCLSAIYVVAPDNTIYKSTTKYTMDNLSVSYDAELIKREHYTPVRTDKQGHKFISCVLHVGKNDSNTLEPCIIYGLVDLQNLYENLLKAGYKNPPNFMIIDGETLDIVMDSRIRANTFEYSTETIKPLKGYSIDEMTKDIQFGDEGRLLFTNNSREVKRLYYSPIGVNKLMAVVYADSSIYTDYRQVKLTYILAIATPAVLYALFLSLIALSKKKSYYPRLRGFNQTVELMDIQRLLLDEGKPEKIREALRLTAQAIKAVPIFVISLEGDKMKHVYAYTVKGNLEENYMTGRNLSDIFPSMYKRLMNGEEVYFDKTVDGGKGMQIESLYPDIKNSTFIPVKNAEDAVIGVFSVINMEGDIDSHIINILAHNFVWSAHNVQNYDSIKEMALTDSLTGLYNRHSYEKLINDIKAKNTTEFCCIYIDVNGLHEINNTMGHSAGDEMLRFVGAALSDTFGEEYCYRIGGDEFLVCLTSFNPKEIESHLNTLKLHIANRGYRISAGMSYTEKGEDPEAIIASAEKLMYDEKRLFYNARPTA